MSNRREFQCQLCKRRYKFQRTLDRHKCKEAQPGASADDVLMNYNVDSHNPVMDMSLMNLTEKDFEGCRITADNEFSVIDAIMKFRGVDSKQAKNIFYEICSGRNFPTTTNFITRHQFPGRRQRPTPVCKFKDLLLLLSQLPGPEAKALRADLMTKGIQSNVDEQLVDYHNPVMDMSLMNLTEKDFEGCRITANNEFSVIDAIMKFRGVDSKQAKKVFYKISSGHQKETTANFITRHQFPGERQRPTPVCKFKDLLLLLSQLSGPEAKALRAQQSEIATRAVAGDLDLERALPQRRAELSSEMQDVVMEGLPSSEPTDELRRRDLEKQYEIKDARRNLEMELFTAEHTRRMEKMRLQAAKEDMDMLESMGLLDDHMRSFVGSSARNIVLSSSYTTSPRLALGKPPTEQTSTDAIWATLERVATVNGLKMSGKDAMRLGRVAAKAVRERFPDETERRDVMCKFQDGEVYASNGKRVLPWHYRGDAKALVAGILRKELPSL